MFIRAIPGGGSVKVLTHGDHHLSHPMNLLGTGDEDRTETCGKKLNVVIFQHVLEWCWSS